MFIKRHYWGPLGKKELCITPTTVHRGPTETQESKFIKPHPQDSDVGNL